MNKIIIILLLFVYSCSKQEQYIDIHPGIESGDLVRVHIKGDSIFLKKENCQARVWSYLYGQAIVIDFNNKCMTYERTKIVNCFESPADMQKEIKNDFFYWH